MMMALALALGFAVTSHEPAPAAPAVMPKGVLAIPPADLRWAPGPPSLPRGAQFAVLEGDPTREGMVTLRLRFPKGFKIAMHTHPGDERVTVLSGAVRITWVDDAGGAAAAQTNTRVFPAGAFYLTPKGMPHVVAVDEDTVIQITVQGPWGIAYRDATDDPRATK